MNPTDSKHEGKDKYFVDVDRMTNEGLAGGYITDDDNGEIDAAVEFEKESSPQTTQKK